jgi:hypothetical protein
VKKIWKLWKKPKLNSEKFWKIWKKSKLNSEKIGTWVLVVVVGVKVGVVANFCKKCNY